LKRTGELRGDVEYITEAARMHTDNGEHNNYKLETPVEDEVEENDCISFMLFLARTP